MKARLILAASLVIFSGTLEVMQPLWSCEGNTLTIEADRLELKGLLDAHQCGAMDIVIRATVVTLTDDVRIMTGDAPGGSALRVQCDAQSLDLAGSTGTRGGDLVIVADWVQLAGTLELGDGQDGQALVVVAKSSCRGVSAQGGSGGRSGQLIIMGKHTGRIDLRHGRAGHGGDATVLPMGEGPQDVQGENGTVLAPDGGDANATASGRTGSNGLDGLDGWSARAEGGNGADHPVRGGRGGAAYAWAGRGSDSPDQRSLETPPGEPGMGGEASAEGGTGGIGGHDSGPGGNAFAIGGDAGNTGTWSNDTIVRDRDFQASDGVTGGNATARGGAGAIGASPGRGGDAEARGGKGGNGGHAYLIHGRGGDGGMGGSAWAYGGQGGGDGGNATARAGRPGNGGNGWGVGTPGQGALVRAAAGNGGTGIYGGAGGHAKSNGSEPGKYGETWRPVESHPTTPPDTTSNPESVASPFSSAGTIVCLLILARYARFSSGAQTSYGRPQQRNP